MRLQANDMLVSDTLRCQVLLNESCRNISSLHFDVTNTDNDHDSFYSIRFKIKKKSSHVNIFVIYVISFDELHKTTPVK